jgi:hypothetical protein
MKVDINSESQNSPAAISSCYSDDYNIVTFPLLLSEDESGEP